MARQSNLGLDTVTAAPFLIAAPMITGNPVIGQVLTCSVGAFGKTPTSYTYQWLRNGVAISGETAATHTIIAADRGTSLSCTVTATNATGSTAVTSPAVYVVPLSISGSFPAATYGAPYTSPAPNVVGGSGTLVFSFSGPVSSGLTIDSATGVLSSLAIVATNNISETITVTDALNATAVLPVVIKRDTGLPKLMTSPLPAGIGTLYEFIPKIENGVAPYTVLYKGMQRSGLRYSNAGGRISGVPTGAARDLPLVITIIDSAFKSVTINKILSIVDIPAGFEPVYIGDNDALYTSTEIVYVKKV